MLELLNKVMGKRTPAEVTGLGLILVLLVGILDYFSGFDLSFSVFYLAPILLVTWYAPRLAGYVMCGISAMAGLSVDITAGRVYSIWFIPVWNAAVRLGFFLVTAFLLGELKIRLQREETLARMDSLTQVYNAGAFKDITDRLLKLAARHNHPSVLGFIDLDNFKVVNDAAGHSAGDLVLQAVAKTLVRCVRSTDVVGRLGGDEFAVFMPEIDLDGARHAFDKIHHDLMREAVERNLSIGFSIGVAVFPDSPSSVDKALGLADRLMYRVKKSGKNQVRYEQPAGGGERGR